MDRAILEILNGLPNSGVLEMWASVFEKPRRDGGLLSQDAGSAYAARCIRACVAMRLAIAENR